MVFSSRKTQEQSSPQKPIDASKKSIKKGLGGLLKRKKNTEDVLPTADIGIGLSRALRKSNIAPTSTQEREADRKIIRETLESIESALYTMDKTREVLQQCFEIAMQARKSEDPAARALLADSYDDLRESLDQIAAETDARGQILVGRNAKNIELELTGRARYSISAFPVSNNQGGLNLSPPINAFDTDEEIIAMIGELREAHKRVARFTTDYCRDAKFLMSRLQEYDTKEKPATRKPSPNISNNLASA